jgi:hypothetical protein
MALKFQNFEFLIIYKLTVWIQAAADPLQHGNGTDRDMKNVLGKICSSVKKENRRSHQKNIFFT